MAVQLKWTALERQIVVYVVSNPKFKDTAQKIRRFFRGEIHLGEAIAPFYNYIMHHSSWRAWFKIRGSNFVADWRGPSKDDFSELINSEISNILSQMRKLNNSRDVKTIPSDYFQKIVEEIGGYANSFQDRKVGYANIFCGFLCCSVYEDVSEC